VTPIFIARADNLGQFGWATFGNTGSGSLSQRLIRRALHQGCGLPTEAARGEKTPWTEIDGRVF